jgi:hypothetical protein
MKQARQKDLAPYVLALSISRIGDRRPKDSGGMNHHYKTCKEIMSKETSKQIFLYSMMTTRMTYESLKRDNYDLTPGESFTFIVREQDRLHTLED